MRLHLTLTLVLWAGVSAFAETTAVSVSGGPQGDNSIAARIEQVSSAYLGKPYKLGPLGEGEGANVDPKPLWRDDQFDCTTYVETTLARAYETNQSDFECLMKNIRYQNGHVAYLDRLHLADADWKPNQEKNGVLSDITLDVDKKAGVAPLSVSANISRATWIKGMSLDEIKTDADPKEKQKVLDSLHGEADKYPDKTVHLNYLSADDLLNNPKLLDAIPSGTVFNAVRRSKDWMIRGKVVHVESLISHQGFLIRKNGQLYVRSASINRPPDVPQSTPPQVSDIPIAYYLQLAKKDLKQPDGQDNLLGFNLMAPQPRPSHFCERTKTPGS